MPTNDPVETDIIEGSFEDAERFVLTDDDGKEETYVVMAIAEIDGKDYALLAAEEDVTGDSDVFSDEMAVYVLEYGKDADGNPDLTDITDEALQEEVYNHFAALMGLEEDDEDYET